MMILEVIRALELDKPIVMGCSIGGRIVLHLALEHPETFRAIIGLQAGAHVDPYYDLNFLHRPDVHGGEVCAAIVSGLVGPHSPESERWETLWHYMQGGPGIFKGDLYFYKLDGDIRSRVAQIDTKRCPLYLLSGEYDYSCTPEETLEVARSIPGSEVTIMEGARPFSNERGPWEIHQVPVARPTEDTRQQGSISAGSVLVHPDQRRVSGHEIKGKAAYAAREEKMKIKWLAAVAIVTLSTSIVHAQEKPPIKIAVVNDQTGVYMETGGPGSGAAARLAVEDFGGEVLGRKIEVMVLDHQNKADIAAALTRKLIDVDKVDLIADGASSAAGLAMNEVARAAKKIFVVFGASRD